MPNRLSLKTVAGLGTQKSSSRLPVVRTAWTREGAWDESFVFRSDVRYEEVSALFRACC